MEDLIDHKRIAAARAAHQSAMEAEGQAGREADRLHLAAASAKRTADRALLGSPAEIEDAEARRDAAGKAAELASRVAGARTAALGESATVMAAEIKQAHAAAVRDAIKRRVVAVRRAAALLAEMAETEAAYRQADRDLQTCQASGGVRYPNEMKIGNGLMDGNGKPIAVALHEAYLKGCGVNVETGQMRWMDAGHE